MLNTWEGAVQFFKDSVPVTGILEIDIAKLLGWTRDRTIENYKYPVMSHIASACVNAHKLIEEGHINGAPGNRVH